MTVRVRGLVALWCLWGVGGVVRGHDVARVVGLMTGRRVEWEE